ncbi:MAG TPA: hypothetical protein VMH83_15030 [Candidatus Acidoferrum sp.]|nr:hypothetical protein [Candidatus Acidoferrum sp.]
MLRRIYHDAPSRVVAWDPAQQFCLEDGFVRCDTLHDLLQQLRNSAGDARIAYVPNLREKSLYNQFDQFCRLAYHWCIQAPCWLCVDELADVSNAGKAPPAWGMLVRTIRKYGAHVWALTQRPQEIDKTILGNLHHLMTFAPSLEKDRKYIISEIGLRDIDIPAIDFHFVQKDRLNQLVFGRLAPPKR